MIAVDTSALMAVVSAEPRAEACERMLYSEADLVISAGTVTEALIVATRRGVLDAMTTLIEGLDFEVVPVSAATATRIGAIYTRWGKGFHPASLNFRDCFAYDLAKENGCPLLFVGNDFSRTDIES